MRNCLRALAGGIGGLILFGLFMLLGFLMDGK